MTSALRDSTVERVQQALKSQSVLSTITAHMPPKTTFMAICLIVQLVLTLHTHDLTQWRTVSHVQQVHSVWLALDQPLALRDITVQREPSLRLNTHALLDPMETNLDSTM